MAFLSCNLMSAQLVIFESERAKTFQIVDSWVQIIMDI